LGSPSSHGWDERALNALRAVAASQAHTQGERGLAESNNHQLPLPSSTPNAQVLGYADACSAAPLVLYCLDVVLRNLDLLALINNNTKPTSLVRVNGDILRKGRGRKGWVREGVVVGRVVGHPASQTPA